MTHGELFAGISGFGLGFSRAGIETLWHVEIDAKCREVLRHHYPDTLLLSDVRDCGAHNLPSVDIISFGSPCQDLSVAGKRRGLIDGKRSNLFFETVRIVDELKPAFAVWENVPGALSSRSGRDFAAVLAAFRDIGARDIAWTCLDAQYFGVAQRRRRVFLVADFRGERAAEVLFESEGSAWDTPPSRETGQRVAASVKASSPSRRNGGSWPVTDEFVVAMDVRNLRTQPDGVSGTLQAKKTGGYSLNYQNPVAFDRTQATVSGDVTGPLRACGAQAEGVNDGKADAQCVAMVASSLGKESYSPVKSSSGQMVDFCIGSQYGVRRLTPTECERLQSFPDSWTAGQSDTARYKQLGNAVCVNEAHWLGRRIVEADHA